LVKVGHLRGKDVDNVPTAGERQAREDVVYDAAKVAADEQLAQTGSVDRVPETAGVTAAVFVILEAGSER
jgi:hypothetical protein